MPFKFTPELAAAQAFGWQIRTADRLPSRASRKLFPRVSKQRATSGEERVSREKAVSSGRGSGDEEQRSDEGGGSSGEDGKKKQQI